MESGRIEGSARRQRRDEGSDEDCREPVPLTALVGQRTYTARRLIGRGAQNRLGGTVSGVSTCGGEIGERHMRE